MKCRRCFGYGETLLWVDDPNNPKMLGYGKCPECSGTGIHIIDEEIAVIQRRKEARRQLKMNMEGR